MNRLSTAQITALVATVVLALAFIMMPLLVLPTLEVTDGNATVVETDPVTEETDEGTVIIEEAMVVTENFTGVDLALGSTPELAYAPPTVSLLTTSVALAVIATMTMFIPAVTRISRYVLLVAGLLALVGYFSIPGQTPEYDVIIYSQSLGYGFWVGALAAVFLSVQAFMGKDTDVVTSTLSNFWKNVRITRQQLLGAILLVIGVATIYQGVTTLTNDIDTTLVFAGHGFVEESATVSPIEVIVPTQLFIVGASVYFVVIGILAMIDRPELKRLMTWFFVLAGALIFLVLLVGSAAGGSTNATTMITESLRTATPIAIGAMAGIWCERSGVINIAIEGMMLTGAAFGFTAVFLLQVWMPDLPFGLTMTIGILTAVLSGGIVSLLHAWLSITFAVDQIISGTVINLLALGGTNFLRREVLLSNLAGVNRLPSIEIPILSDLPFIGPVFAGQPIFYMMFVVIILTHIVLFHTRWGLRTIAVGENPHAADTLGIKVNRVRWINVFIGGMIAGLAGAWFSLEAAGRFTDGMTDGKGFISLAAMIFGKWTPSGSFGGSLLFGFSEALGFRFQIEGVGLPVQFLTMVPYIVTLIVLAGLVGRAFPPKAIGQPYKTEGSN